MAELKTKETNASVSAFLNKIKDKKRKEDCFSVLELMKGVTREQPKMWGPSIVGFGRYHYIYASGRSGDWLLTGFSPRKQNLTLYIMGGFDKYPDQMKKLGKFKTAKSCLYINRLEEINKTALKELIKLSVRDLKLYVQKQKISKSQSVTTKKQV